MAINFPDAPSLNQEHTVGSTTWKWDGTVWNALGVTVSSIVVADESADTTCFPLFATAATGAIEPKTGTNLTFNSSTGQLGATSVRATDSGSADYIDISTNATNSVINQSGGSSMVFQTGGVNRFGVGPDYTWGTVSHIIQEKAAATADIATYGQLWVKTAVPNQLYFTGDTGVDIQITDATGIAAASISSGNLGSGVLPYVNVSGTSVAYKMVFANTTTNTAGNYQILMDSLANLTYNPSTNQLAVGNIITTGDVGGTTIGGITQANLLDKTATETISGSYTHTAQSHNNDNVVVNFGTGDDFGIYFDIVDSTLRAIGATNDIKLMVNTSEVALRCIPDGAVELAHNGIVKLRTALHTTSDGGTGADVVDGLGTFRPVGFNVIPPYEIDVADTFDLAHNGMMWHRDGTATIAFTCDSDTNIPVGATYMVANENATGALTIAQGTATIRWFEGTGTPTTGTRTLAEGGMATVYKYADAEFWVWGSGIT